MATDTGAPLRRQTVTDMVADYITRKIIAGELHGGQQIRQEAVAAELGVSRIPVREALLQLEADGLVVIRTHRGAVVSSLSAQDAEDLFDARLLLEPFLIKKAISAANGGHLSDIEEAMNSYERAVRSSAEPRDLSRLNWEFHTALLTPAGRPRSLGLVQALHNSADRYLRFQIEPQKAREKAVADHHEIMVAFRARDKEEAAKLLRRHIADAAREIHHALRDKHPE